MPPYRIAIIALFVLEACSEVSEAPSAAADAERSRFDRALDQGLLAALDAAPRAQVVSRGDEDDHGRFMVTPIAVGAASLPAELDGETAARLHWARYADDLGVSEQGVREAVLDAVHSLHGAAAIYHFSQRAAGLPVFQARASVVLDASKNLVSLANGMVQSRIVEDAVEARWILPAQAALGTAYAAAGGPALLLAAAIETSENAGWHSYEVATPPGAARVVDAAARAVMFPMDDRLIPAYQVELLMRARVSFAYAANGYVIAADDGRVLWQTALTRSESFSYRVFAETSGDHAPLDGPLVDSAPHPTGTPDRYQPGFGAPALVDMAGFNKNMDPWLDASATYTFGNNVRAFSDRNQTTSASGLVTRNDGYNDGVDYRADVTAERTFDRSYDLNQDPDVTSDQIKASVAQLFYTTNWLHDYYYDSGFDEASGNAQLSNFGRGGAGNDPLLAEAQDSADSGASNNANMSTLSDGRSPRMQMYVWTGLPNRALTTDPQLTLDDWIGAAGFGPQTFALPQADLVLADDASTRLPSGATGSGAPSVSDACQVPTNVRGKIAVIDRGICTFVSKLENAERGGALGALVLDNAPGHSSPAPGGSGSTASIPLLTLSYEDGQKLKAALSSGAVRATAFSRGDETPRDGSIDNTVVAHEWGHYLHQRLSSGSSASYGGMSEGWGDFTALLLTIREGDTFSGKVYPLAQYAAGGFDPRSAYFGIRRAPYSVELDKNPFTFKHVRESAKLPTTAPLWDADETDMNEAHNVGEIWAQMLFECYVNVLTAGQAAGRGFAESKRRMTDYVVAGLKAAPPEPTFTEQRDAILAGVRAMAASDPTRNADVEAIAKGFAKRGLGANAIAPPARSNSLDEAVEDFSVPSP